MLRFYGNMEEEEAQKDLEKAIVSDLADNPGNLQDGDKQFQMLL